MAVKITDSETLGNGKDGINIGPGVDVDIQRSRSNNNKGGGIVVENDKVGIVQNNSNKSSWFGRYLSDASVKFAAAVTIGLIGVFATWLWN